MKYLLLILLASPAMARTYSTDFNGTENPISEGGNWTNGSAGSAAIWGDVRETPNFAFGANQPSSFGDPTAIVNGTWGPVQSASATVKINTTPNSNIYEAEIRLRTTITANSITGYEAYCTIVTNGDYCYIARWNGPSGSYCNLDGYWNLHLLDGDILAADISGTNPTTIHLYVNGTLRVTVNDTGADCSPGGPGGPFTSGSPGIGFYRDTDSNWNYFGFTHFQASDGGVNTYTPLKGAVKLSGTAVLR
jgi:hypothetical protein